MVSPPVVLSARSKGHITRYDVCRDEKITFSLVARLAAVCLLLALLARTLVRMPRWSPPAAPFTFDAYFCAMNGDLDLYSTSVYADTPQFQRALHRHQSPADCQRARFLVFELWNHGLGSAYIGASTALALAAASGRVLYLVPPPAGWVHAKGCPDPGATCFFQPATPCVLPSATLANATAVNQHTGWLPSHPARVLRLRFEKPFLGPARRNLSALANTARMNMQLPRAAARGRREIYASARAWHTQANLYLLRLNARMQTLARAGLAVCSTGADAGQFARQTLGVPLRGSDKCGGHGREMACVSAADVAGALARFHAAQPWIGSALVTSEDASFASQVEKHIGPEWLVRRSVGDVQQGSGHPMAKHGFSPKRVMESVLVTMTCQVMPVFHVLAIRSNFHSLIDMLAKVVPGKPMHFSYSLGDIHNPW